MKNIKIENFKEENLLEELNNKLYTEEFSLKHLIDDGVTARHLQYWDENDLLPNKKRKEDENHKFSFADLIWIKLINELRLFSFPIRKIKYAKEELLKQRTFSDFLNLKNDEQIIGFLFQINQGKFKSKSEFLKSKTLNVEVKFFKTKKISVLVLLVVMFILTRENSKFIFLNTGEVSVVNELILDKFPDLLEALEEIPHIIIPLNKLFKSFIDNETNAPFISTIKVLNESELRILAMVRHGDFDKLNIIFKDKKPFLVEATRAEKINKEARISEILMNRNYEKIEIISNGGNLTYAPRTTKIFFK